MSGEAGSEPGQVASVEVSTAAMTALVLEIVFGLFGILGVGHAYARRLGLALVLLVGWWIALIVILLVVAGTLGFTGFCLAPLWIAVPIISGLQARQYVLKSGETGSWPLVAAFAGGGCLLLLATACVGMVTVIGLAGLVGSLSSS